MPQQKATSFADDLAALEQGSSFADDLASLEQPKRDEPAKKSSGLGRFAGVKMLGDAVMGAGKAALDNPVQAGAMLGGLAAAPFTGGASILAAGAGAAGGAGLGSIVNAIRGGENGPSTAGGVLKTMAGQGAAGAAGQGLGVGASKLLKAGGKLVYKTALRPSATLQREFGDVSKTGLRGGVPVSEGGVGKAVGKITQSSGRAKQMIADAEAGGASPLQPKEVATAFGDVFKQGRNQAALGRPDPRPAVMQRLQTFGQRNPNGIPLSRAQELKTEAQDLASKAYRAEDLGHPITDLSAASDKAMATGLREGIEKRVPGVADVNKHTQELIGLTRALEDATRRNVPGVGSLRTLLGDFAPSMASRGGIALDRAGGLPLPASMRTAALLAALAGEQ